MTTVHGRLLGPAASPPAPGHGTVSIVLIDYTDTAVIGFDTVDQTEILAPYTAVAATDGTWTVDLIPNAQIQLAGGTAATAWRVTENNGSTTHSYPIVVPAGGPFWAGDLRTTLVTPSAPSPVANLAVNGALTVGGVFTLDTVPLGTPPNDSSKFLSGDGSWRVGGGAVSSVNTHVGAVVLTAADVGALATAQNLADLPAPATARTSLGLGNSATRSVGTTAGTVAAGDDSRIVNAVTSRDQHASKLGLLLEPFPIETISEMSPGLGLVSGNLYGQLSRPTSRQPLVAIGMWLCSAGSGPTASSYVALLNESGDQLGVSVDMTSYLTNVANEGKFIEIPLVSPTAALDLDTGYYPCVLSSLSSIPKIAGCLPAMGTFAIPRIRGHLAGWFSGGLSSVPSHVDLLTVSTAVASYYIVGLPA
ncbi:MAG: hypothetical protein YHS30scaffold324_59 [Catenulispora phage 69_17]|nr:MAG: hypothetical protein YHS30scaffold324_59 [Catenulispora phage 69_17]